MDLEIEPWCLNFAMDFKGTEAEPVVIHPGKPWPGKWYLLTLSPGVGL